jgi:hypothetical protein
MWAFVNRYFAGAKRERGVPMALTPCVLPITFHRETVELLRRRRFDGGLLNALADDQSFPIEIQQRMEDMLPQTFEALNVGFAARLFALDKTTLDLKPLVSSRPSFGERQIHRDMFATAERLAHWFLVYPSGQISHYLQLAI